MGGHGLEPVIRGQSQGQLNVRLDGGLVMGAVHGEFVGAVPQGSLVECRGEVVKAGRSMVFVRGLITTGDEPVMNFSAVIKKTRPRDAA